MVVYRLYYCKEDILRFSAHQFQAMNDVQAMDHVDRRVTPLHAPIFELWQGERLVLRRNRYEPRLQSRLQTGRASAFES